MPKRLDSPDTVDTALAFLRSLQAEGWGLKSLEHHVEYVSLKSGGRKLPVAAVLTVRLVPSR